MKILVTGASGFIGRHLVERLLKNNVSVIALDKSNTDVLENFSGDLKIVKIDITQPFEPSDIEEDIDIVIHLAGIVGEEKCSNDIENAINVNVNGLINVINSLNDTKIKKFIFISTANVYDLSNKMPVNENSAVLGDGIYNSTKLAGEFLVSGYCNKMKIPFNILRVSQLYGPYQPFGTVISDIIEKLLKSNLLKIKDPSVVLDFVYISDVIDAILFVLESDNNGIFNVSTCIPTELNEIIKMVAKILVKQHDVETHYDKDDMRNSRRCWIDNSKLKSLGWELRISLIEGMEETINFFRTIETNACEP
ncbi:MAG: NAD(P)-dependent oxidoreductase [Bacteroidetes bacterium]|nr:NAD(P)-dependent oxidoreductase [Bacteroidota bacterium]